MKDNHGTITKVNRKDVTPIEMDIKIAELFNKSRQNSKIRDAQLAMPTSKIPDLDWQFDKDIQLVEPTNEQIKSLPTVHKTQTTKPTVTTLPMTEETVPAQPIEEVTTESIPTDAVEKQAARKQNTELYQINLQTPMVSKIFAVLKPVVTAVTQQITNKTHF